MYVSDLYALRLHVSPEAQFIHLLGVGDPIVPHYGVGEGQDLASVAGVCQRLRIPSW